MDPPIGVSIVRVSPNRWLLGSSMACQKIDDSQLRPANAIAQWQGGGSTFFLQERSADEKLQGDARTDRIHVGGTSGAVWLLGNTAFCKAHAWCEGMELEANNIRFVRDKAPQVPVPELIHAWIDQELNRTFVITKRVSGQTLDQAWPQLSSSDRGQIANEIAGFCAILALNKSSHFRTVTGHGVHEPRLMERPHRGYPTWKPRLLGPFSQEALQAYMTILSKDPAPHIDSEFLFYHADLGPRNIMVSEDDHHVTGVIDWESAAYYPRFWIATKPVAVGAFWLGCEDEEPKLWGQLLGQALERHGYERDETVFRSWKSSLV